MKKTKILTIIGVVLAMGLAGCKGGSKSSSTSSGKGSSSNPPSSQSSGGGKSSSSSSSSQGPAAYVKPIHHWSSADTDPKQEANASLGTIEYYTRSCTDHTGEKGIELPASAATVVSGTKKVDSNFPTYVKMGNNGDAIEIKFEYNAYAKGTLFFRGVMDYWQDGSNNNEQKTFYTVKDSSHENGNFAVEINGKAVDFSKMQDVTFEEMLLGEKQAVGNGFSALDEAEVGSIAIHEGVNTLKFTRVDSYNMLIKDFVLAVKDEAHEHTTGGWEKISDQDCENPEMQKAVCTVCGAEQVRANPDKPALGHDLGAATEVAANAEAGTVYYKKAQCSRCHKFQYEIPTFVKNDQEKYVLNGVFTKGSNKSGTPDGYMKLNSDNDVASFKLSVDKVLVGKIYQLGMFDNWPSNKDFGYFSANDSKAQADIAHATGNFEVSVNGEPVDITWLKPAPMSDFIKDETSRTFGEDTTKWSNDALCPIGEVALDKGVNTIDYKRIQSYNLAVKALVLIVDELDHTHTPGTAFKSDENGHWHECTDPNCPVKGVKLNYEAHNLVASSTPDTPSTCAEHGHEHKVCSICEKAIDVELPLADHEWEEKQTEPATTNADGKTIVPLECKNCHKVGAKMSVGDFSTGELDGSNYKFKGNTSFSYKIKVAKAGDYTLYIGGKYSSGNGSKTLAATPVTVKVGETEFPVSTASFSSLGMSSSSVKQFVLAPKVTLAQGENEIVISQGNGGYRLTYGGDVAVYEQ